MVDKVCLILAKTMILTKFLLVKLGKYAIVLFIIFKGSALAQTVSFTTSFLAGENISTPTSLQFGPDGRLYVSQQDGTIYAYTIIRNGPNDYQVIDTETISLIKQIPNYNDDGTANPGVYGRLVTGLLVTGTPTQPVIYVTSSDKRVGGGGTTNNTNLDTNSGIISKLTKNGNSWSKLDLVRGLPRSEHNHALNGMQLDEINNILYVASGGNTNMGAPSNNFVFLPEYALSAAILSVDLNAIGATTYDLPTLDDEDRPGVHDLNDPFGGNDGKNQAVIVPGGPVQVYSPGWRNIYDLLISESGRMYTFDNGPNAGWGGLPNNCSNEVSEPGNSYCDNLHYVTGPGYYGGHPNPVRADRNNTVNVTNPQSPIPVGGDNPVECNYLIPGVQDGAIATICASTNGICEYTASNFGNAMKGDLIAASFNGMLYRFKLTPDGDALVPGGQLALASGFGSSPLDVTAQGDNDIFAGTIWAVTYTSGNIAIFEPNDFNGCTPNPTSYIDDADGDGYSDADEIDNGTDPCNPASIPEDFDGDFISDLNDPDDDNDGIPDNVDLFALDPSNGLNTTIPVRYAFENTDEGGIRGWGFTGLMTNYTSDYSELFNSSDMTVGGAAFKFTVDNVSPGDAYQANNNQKNGFQFGVNVGNFSNKFTVSSGIMGPFAGIIPTNYQSMGMFIGNGDQDNYLKIVTAANNGLGGIQVLMEQQGGITSNNMYNVPVLGANTVDLYLTVDPSNNTVQPAYSIDGGTQTDIGSPSIIPANWLDDIIAVGFISTSFSSGSPFAATWDFIEVTSDSIPLLIWYRDLDGDQFGSTTDSVFSRTQPVGYVANNDDCDDSNSAINPNSIEILDGLDNDCDGEIDEGFATAGAIFINCGGPEYVSFSGDTFIADAYFSPAPGTKYLGVGPIDNTNDEILYLSERYGNPFSYNIPLPDGDYTVNLHFAEVYSGAQAPGIRVMDISIESTTVLTGYDIISDVGYKTAVIKSFSTPLNDGTLNIDFSATANNAKISAISVFPLDSPPDSNTPPTFSLSGDVTVQENFTTTEIVSVTPDPVPPDESTQTVIYSLSPVSVSFANISFNALTGQVTISAVPDSFGTQLFTVTADDQQSENNIAVESFTLTVSPVEDTIPNKPPTFSLSGDVTVQENFTTIEIVSVTPDPVPPDESTQTVIYSLSPASVSFANISFNALTGQVTISAVPDSFGTQLFTVTADDQQPVNNIAVESFTLTVSPVDEPIDLNVTLLAIDNSRCDIDCNGTLEAVATGGAGDYSYSWSTHPNPTIITRRINAFNNDSEEHESDGSILINGQHLDLGYQGSNEQLVGMRFGNITIPKSAVITNAYIEFTARFSESKTTNVTFFGEDVDNSVVFTTGNSDISNRPLTNSSVNWSNVGSWSAGNVYNSPNLSNVIQEIVNRPGWISGNALTIIVDGTGQRSAVSYDNNASTAPRLVLTYHVGNPVLQNLCPGNYSVTVTDKEGTSVNTSATVDQQIIDLSINPTVIDNASCGRIAGVPESLYCEQFNYPDGTTSSSEWTATCNSCDIDGNPDHFEVRSNRWSARNLDGEGVWISRTIDISNYQDISASVDLSESGPMENSDYIRVFYIIDGGSETFFTTNGNLRNDFSSATASVSDLNGNSLQIVIRITNNAINEIHRFDNVCVEGTLPASACTGSINLSVSGGASPYLFNWSNGETNQNLNGLCAGRYFLTVSDSHGCTAEELVVVEDTTLILMTTYNNPSCFGYCNGSANISALNGVPPYSYSWSTGATTPGIKDLCADSFSVSVTDDLGCTALAGILLETPPQLSITTTTTDITCVDLCNGTASVVVSGGRQPYSYSWSNGDNTPFTPQATQNGLCAGTYHVTVTDTNGCEAVDSILLSALPIPPGDCDCFGNRLDECGVCAGPGIPPGDCDCNGNKPDECGVCGGTGVPHGDCDCFGNQLDECGVCDGPGIPDGYCDCNGNQFDECGVCGGPGISTGNCDCFGNVADECGVCGGDGAACACSLAVKSFTLVYEGTVGDIRTLNDGDVISRDTLCRFNIRAEVCPDSVASVMFLFNGNWHRTESVAPLAFNGDNPVGNYFPWIPPTGTYTITAIPYSGHSATGNAGPPKEISFTIVGSVSESSSVCLGPPIMDCNGDFNGLAFIDDCGICAGGHTGIVAISCDDGDPCTIDQCDPVMGCINTPIDIENELPYLRAINVVKSWSKLKIGYDPASLWLPKQNVIAGGNHTLCITLRDPNNTVNWNQIQVRPQANSNDFEVLGDYVPAGGIGSSWTEICIPLSAFTLVDFTNLTLISLPYSNGADVFEIHIQKVEFNGGATPFLWFGNSKTDNYHDGQSGNGGALFAELIEVSPCTSAKHSQDEPAYENMPFLDNPYLNAYPNPFSERVIIEFSVAHSSKVKVEVLGVDGRKIETLFDGNAEGMEYYKFYFHPGTLSNGMYFYRLTTSSGQIYTKKLALIR